MHRSRIKRQFSCFNRNGKYKTPDISVRASGALFTKTLPGNGPAETAKGLVICLMPFLFTVDMPYMAPRREIIPCWERRHHMDV